MKLKSIIHKKFHPGILFLLVVITCFKIYSYYLDSETKAQFLKKNSLSQLVSSGNFTAALDTIDSILLKKPHDMGLILLKTQLLYSEKKYEQARQMLDLLDDTSPSSEILLCIALTYFNEKDIPNANDYFEAAICEFEDRSDSRSIISLALTHAVMGRTDEALQYLEELECSADTSCWKRVLKKEIISKNALSLIEDICLGTKTFRSMRKINIPAK